ncbi:BTAD domain-containing putative transcriptional regulator [Phytohabitans houttuyneae]|nr:BTAD domain-containing putative transcriptional regulator [Phytohabitans houttuyneae]
MATVLVEVLGPLRLTVDGVAVDVRGAKRRAVLALLALAEGRTVPVDQLVDALWPGEVPESGRQALHSHVFRLRGHLGPASGRLRTLQDGYRLDLGGDGLDVARARALLAAGRAADPERAFQLLTEADALWRGPMLADLADVGPIAAAVAGHAQLRRDVADALVTSGIAAGRVDEVVARAAAAVAEDPLREPAVLAHMRALAATGQAAQALRAGREYRARLADEAGLDPSPALDDLVREIAAGSAPAQPTRPATRLFGRDPEIAALRRLLAGERLVTLVGPGGVGKTRVALEVAARGGTATVLRLAPVTDPAALPHALAAALGLKVVQRDVLASCVAVLADTPGLLVVDNCEHLLDAARDLTAAVLAACPEVTVLATSREPLGLAAECVSRLPPLPLPGAGEDLPRVASVAVFLDRAGRVRQGVASAPDDLRLVADIVRRLDGIPLAIELAAGRLSTFSLADLHGRLDRSLDLLGGRPSGEARHGTLRETVEWSYRLLTDDERRLFRHLSIFADGVDLATAEQLAADLGLGTDPGSALARLVDASMVEAHFGAGTRYRMLETLRAFGLDRLAAAGEAEAAAAHLVRWAVALTGWIETTMSTEREPDADAVLRRELPNLRAAWRLARSGGRLDEAAAIVTALYHAIAYRDLVEIRDWAEELADDPALDGHPRAAAVFGTAAEAAYHRGDYARADRLARAGFARDGGSWHCRTVLSIAALARNDWDDVVSHSLAAAALTDRPYENLGIAALGRAYAGDTEAAWELNERGLAGAPSPSMRGWATYVAGEIDNCAGRHEEAERRYRRAIDLARTSGATFLAGVATVGLLAVRARMGRVQDALRGYREVVDYFARTGNWTHQWVNLRNLADLLRRLGDGDAAARIDAAANAAPDAPAVDGARPAGPAAPVLGRAAVLDLAREAIDRNLSAPPAPRTPRR